MIQSLLQGRQTGAYGDLAPGGHEFLSRSRVQTPQNGKQRLFHALIPHSQEESKIRRSSSAPFDLKAKRLYDLPRCGERLLSCGHSSFASKILRQSPCDPGFRQGDLHPSAARRLLVLQARQQPCTSVFRHPQASTAILLPSHRMEPLRSCFRMDGQPKDLGRCHERW